MHKAFPRVEPRPSDSYWPRFATTHCGEEFMMPPELNGFDKDELKELMKEAWKESFSDFMQDVFRKFGKWSLATLGALLVGLLIYMILTTHGWRPPQS